MNLLPKEVLFEIFQYLDARDLIALTTVCSSFNDIVSGSKLAKKLIMNFRKVHGEYDSIGDRKYSQLRIGFYKATFHSQVLKEIGKFVTNLSFKNCTLKIDIVRKILLATPSVSWLRFERMRLSDVPNRIKLPFPNLSNVRLKCSGTDPRLYRIFNNCSITELSISHSASDNYADFSDLVDLLNSQENLKHLSIDGFCRTTLFASSALEKVKFALTSFSVTNSMFDRTVHLKSFVEHQSKSLKKLEVKDVELCDFSTVINNLNNLISISISKASMCYLEPLTTVEDLTVEGQKIVGDIFSKLPSLKRLTLKWIRSQIIMEDVSQNMKELESVHLSESSLNGFHVPTMKNLSLVAIDQCPADFFADNNQVEILNLENCFFVEDQTVISITENLRKLKSFRLINCEKITNKSLIAIRDNCKKLCEIVISGSNGRLDWKILAQEKENQIKIYVS